MTERPLLSPRLKDLPITSEDTYHFGEFELDAESDDASGISLKYRRELAQVRSAKELKKFVHRWRVLWILDRVHAPKLPLCREHDALYRGRFNARKVWRAFNKLSRQSRSIGKSGHWRAAVSIKIPPAFLRAMFIASEYEVPEDIALIQMYQGVEFF